ncbi:hypothetical protein M1146_06560, partial [Patescibacteria group bacterium]|nr:hypothetical protein [Patescibacteria group bacterium]
FFCFSAISFKSSGTESPIIIMVFKEGKSLRLASNYKALDKKLNKRKTEHKKTYRFGFIDSTNNDC